MYSQDLRKAFHTTLAVVTDWIQSDPEGRHQLVDELRSHVARCNTILSQLEIDIMGDFFDIAACQEPETPSALSMLYEPQDAFDNVLSCVYPDSSSAAAAGEDAGPSDTTCILAASDARVSTLAATSTDLMLITPTTEREWVNSSPKDGNSAQSGDMGFCTGELSKSLDRGPLRKLRAPRKTGLRRNGTGHTAIAANDAPGSTIQPRAVHARLMDMRETVDTHSAQVLTKLSYGLGSPASVFDLVRACNTLSSRRTLLFQHDTGIGDTIAALEHLDAADCATKVLRRLYLTRLCDLRHQRTQFHSQSQAEYGDCTRGRKAARAASLALDDIIASVLEGEPTASQSVQKRVWVENKLRRGRNWYILSQHMPLGVIILIPQHGPFAVCDSKIEKVNGPVFNHFISLLLEHRGHFLKQIGEFALSAISEIGCEPPRMDLVPEALCADMDGSELFDSPRLIEICQLLSRKG